MNRLKAGVVGLKWMVLARHHFDDISRSYLKSQEGAVMKPVPPQTSQILGQCYRSANIRPTLCLENASNN
jgi:hypothetical protein